MNIDNVRDVAELDAVLKLAHEILPRLDNDEHRYSRDFWLERMAESPQLLLCAKGGSEIRGSAFACADGRGVTIGHCIVADSHRNKGVGRALMAEMERRIRQLGHANIALGSVAGAESFYAKLGYTGSLLVQSEEHSVDQLQAANDKYEVIGTNVYEGKVSQVWLRLPLIDRAFQRHYEQALPGCYTQMTFGKAL